ncbi:MAG: hypothetical protein IJC34_04900 [Lentisphaeria bacterium]|nr:hypothetical protein [Lentisphaeria bacterium]
MRFLSELHRTEKVIWTAHRGASFEDAENTLSGFRRAVEAGADMIEFDIRMSRDGVPVILHDRTVDRTSNMTGEPEKHTFAELKKGEFTFFSRNKRLTEPLHPGEGMPSFEEVLAEFGEKVCMNMQIYASRDGLAEICRLYLKYNMTDKGYMTIADMGDADFVRQYSPDIEICLTPGWDERADPEKLKLCADYGCRFVQPVAETVTPETFQLCRDLGLRANVFFADTGDEVRRMTAMGARSFLTNRIGDMKALDF